MLLPVLLRLRFYSCSCSGSF
eukprot:COSAG04_NODE_17481_length_468_cov_1.089431_1_plen_20_part_10